MNKRPARWTHKEEEFIRKVAKNRSAEKITELVNAEFGRNYSVQQIVSFKLVHKIRSFESVQIGAETIRSRGDIYVKVEVSPARWIPKKKFVWERVNGDIPDGHVLLLLDGDKNNCDVSNLLLVSRRQLAIINKYRLLQDDADLNKSVVAVADLLLAVSERSK